MADPTNARMRPVNAFFDAPRFPIKTLPAIDAGDPGPITTTTTTTDTAPPPATTVTVTTDTPAPTPPAAVAPTVSVFLPKARTKKVLLGIQGLAFKVATDVPVSDVEVRLFEVLAGGALRPVGGAFKQAPPAAGVTVKVIPTAFARARTKRGKSTYRVVATATSFPGAVGRTQATFTLR